MCSRLCGSIRASIRHLCRPMHKICLYVLHTSDKSLVCLQVLISGMFYWPTGMVLNSWKYFQIFTRDFFLVASVCHFVLPSVLQHGAGRPSCSHAAYIPTFSRIIYIIYYMKSSIMGKKYEK